MTKAVPSDDSRGVAGGVVFLLVHVVLWLGLLAGLVVIVPRFVRTFEDFNAALPAMTLLVIQMSRMAVAYWYLLALGALAAIFIDGLVLVGLGKSGGRAAQFVWGLVFAVLPLLLVAVVFLAIWLPMMNLIDGLR